MSQPTRPAGDCEDLLRRALHSAVDPIEPADDGLERIRTRLTAPDPLPVAWVVAVCAEVAGRARGGLQSALAWLQSVPQRLMPGPSEPSGQAPEGYGASPQATSRRPRFGRARLAAVVAAITLVMAMSVSAVTPFGQQIWSQAGALLNAIGGVPPGSGAGGQGSGQTGAGGLGNGQQAGTGAVAAHGASNHGQPAASCPSSTPALAAPAASPASSSSPASPSPDVSPSTPSSSPDVSPSPAGSSSAVNPSPTSASQASPSASPSSRALAGAGQTAPRRASVDVTGQSSDPCASPTRRPAQSTPSPTPRPNPSSAPGATLGPTSPPPTSPAPPAPSSSSPPAVSPSPSSAGATSTAPATSSPASSGPADASPASSS